MFYSVSSCCVPLLFPWMPRSSSWAFFARGNYSILSLQFSIFNLLGFNIIGVTYCACLGLGSFVGRTDNHPSLCQPHGSEYTTGLAEARQVLRFTQKVRHEYVRAPWDGKIELSRASGFGKLTSQSRPIAGKASVRYSTSGYLLGCSQRIALRLQRSTHIGDWCSNFGDF